MKENDHLGAYIVITFSLSIVLSLFIGFTGGHESTFIWMGYLSMIIPAGAVLAMTFTYREPVSLPGRKKKISIGWILIAIFLIPAVIHVACIPLTAYLHNGRLPWQAWLTPDKNGFYNAPEKVGWGVLTYTQLVFKIATNAAVGLMIVSTLAFFEEIGWRAWMLPRLFKRFPVKKGIVLGAAIWAIWHIPFMLSGILYLKDISPFQTVLIHPFGIFGAGLIINWLWLRTKSIWIVSLAHGALNNWGQYAFKFMEDKSLNAYDQFILFTGVNATLLVTGIIILLTLNPRRS
ncbi:CPBP family intramembrane metalloprotease [Danxiaibacter flavus]|uniref:CPBP family intramembrane metalloprotease n=1 Tax=Danxiaibacter flavus TaxID=3049108 RepID=A0ABV3ZI97_9BACT|nr:CPBP family intramembrane metalloprotease [Chitinophagaceae bacterium DXS]